jgi:hypothetical protein
LGIDRQGDEAGRENVGACVHGGILEPRNLSQGEGTGFFRESFTRDPDNRLTPAVFTLA